MPRASSRSSLTASCASSRACATSFAAPSGSLWIRDSASPSVTATATSRCCAPSWRSRSIRRRSASAAAMIRCRAVAQVVDAVAQQARTPLLGRLAWEADLRASGQSIFAWPSATCRLWTPERRRACRRSARRGERPRHAVLRAPRLARVAALHQHGERVACGGCGPCSSPASTLTPPDGSVPVLPRHARRARPDVSRSRSVPVRPGRASAAVNDGELRSRRRTDDEPGGRAAVAPVQARAVDERHARAELRRLGSHDRRAGGGRRRAARPSPTGPWSASRRSSRRRP